jgi:hypothetical protein
VDRDLLSPTEVADQKTAGVQVLGRRNIEAYLLDDEVIDAFALAQGDATVGQELRAVKTALMSDSVNRGNDPDDLKKIAGEWAVAARKRFKLVGSGSTWEAFATDFLAPHLAPGVPAYADLKASIFGR